MNKDGSKDKEIRSLQKIIDQLNTEKAKAQNRAAGKAVIEALENEKNILVKQVQSLRDETQCLKKQIENMSLESDRSNGAGQAQKIFTWADVKPHRSVSSLLMGSIGLGGILYVGLKLAGFKSFTVYGVTIYSYHGFVTMTALCFFLPFCFKLCGVLARVECKILMVIGDKIEQGIALFRAITKYLLIACVYGACGLFIVLSLLDLMGVYVFSWGVSALKNLFNRNASMGG